MSGITRSVTHGTPVPIQLVGSMQGPTTGLSRYARSLHEALSGLGLEIQVAGALPPPLPRPLKQLAGGFGFDLESFFSTYPVRMPRGPAHGGITHVTSQNQASALAWRGPTRLIISVHDLITIAYRHNPEMTGYLTIYDKFFDNLSIQGLRKADALIADSEHTRQDILRVLGYPVEQTHVVHLGVHHTIFRPVTVPPEFVKRYGLRGDMAAVLYIGSEDPRKNLRRLIDAFMRVLEVMPQARLLKVGAARFQRERDQLLAYIRQRGLEERVLFFDQVPDQDLTFFYNYAKAFVFPSLYEGFGLPPLEAMACGTPVITSNASSLPEVVGDAALTVDPYDVNGLAAAMLRVLRDEPLRAELRGRGLARAAGFTWERAARETLDVYRSVLGVSSKTSASFS